MKKLILLAFMLIANVFAGEAQEMMCGDKSLLYCINHFDKQCQAKNYGACFTVGYLHWEKEQYSQAKKYYEMVCDEANSKDSFAMELIDDSMTPKVPIIKFMQSVCVDLGILYYNGKGVRQSYEKALHYYKKACDLGDGNSCAFAGGAYLNGKGVQESLKTALKFYTKSCELEFGVGCVMLGLAYHNGDVVKQNYSKAKELYGKACDLGSQKGCDWYKELQEEGVLK